MILNDKNRDRRCVREYNRSKCHTDRQVRLEYPSADHGSPVRSGNTAAEAYRVSAPALAVSGRGLRAIRVFFYNIP